MAQFFTTSPDFWSSVHIKKKLQRNRKVLENSMSLSRSSLVSCKQDKTDTEGDHMFLQLWIILKNTVTLWKQLTYKAKALQSIFMILFPPFSSYSNKRLCPCSLTSHLHNYQLKKNHTIFCHFKQQNDNLLLLYWFYIIEWENSIAKKSNVNI